MRTWAKAKGLSGGGGGQLTSYALTLMALYYLQCVQPPVVPSLQNLGSWPVCTSENDMISSRKETVSANDVNCTYEHKIDMELDSCDCCGENGRNVESNVIADGWDCSYFKNIAKLIPSDNQQPLG